jgi:hypothetical protein
MGHGEDLRPMSKCGAAQHALKGLASSARTCIAKNKVILLLPGNAHSPKHCNMNRVACKSKYVSYLTLPRDCQNTPDSLRPKLAEPQEHLLQNVGVLSILLVKLYRSFKFSFERSFTERRESLEGFYFEIVALFQLLLGARFVSPDCSDTRVLTLPYRSFICFMICYSCSIP